MLLFVVALLIYQQQALVAFALLAIPIINGRKSDGYVRFAFLYSSLTAVTTALYYVAWAHIYRTYWPGNIDYRYGPDAVRLPSIDQVTEFLQRLTPLANFWRVHSPIFDWIVALLLIVIAYKIVIDIRANAKDGARKWLMIIALLIACDIFRLAAHAYPSYVTAPALTVFLFYLSFVCVSSIIRAPLLIAGSAAIFGCFCAFANVRGIAVPNWGYTRQIESAIRSNPQKADFYIVGIAGQPVTNPAFWEFAWRNGDGDSYLYLNSLNAEDELRQKKLLSPDQKNIRFSIGPPEMVVTSSVPH